MGNDLSLSAEVTIVSAWNNHENTVFLPYKLKAVRHQLGYYICTFQEFIPVLRSDHSEKNENLYLSVLSRSSVCSVTSRVATYANCTCFVLYPWVLYSQQFMEGNLRFY